MIQNSLNKTSCESEFSFALMKEAEMRKVRGIGRGEEENFIEE